jgi:hypothetical protein
VKQAEEGTAQECVANKGIISIPRPIIPLPVPDRKISAEALKFFSISKAEARIVNGDQPLRTFFHTLLTTRHAQSRLDPFPFSFLFCHTREIPL